MASQSLLSNLQSISQSNFHSLYPKFQLPQFLKPYNSPNRSNFGTLTTHFSDLSFLTSNSRLESPATRTVSATVFSSLPTANPERFASAEEVPKWSWRAIKAFTMAQLEARKLKRPHNGTESLLLGIIIEGTSVAAMYLWANGITLLKARDEIVKLLGKPDMYYFPPEQPPLSESAQRALDWAVDHKLRSGSNGEVTTSDMLLGIWSEVDSPGHQLLATLGFNDDKAKELESLSSGPGFIEG